MSKLSWEEKLAAFQALSEHSLRMRAPGNWYVSADIMLKEARDSGVVVGTYGNGVTPANAVHDHWNKYVAEIPDDGYVWVPRGERRVRWNGFMWADVPA